MISYIILIVVIILILFLIYNIFMKQHFTGIVSNAETAAPAPSLYFRKTFDTVIGCPACCQ